MTLAFSPDTFRVAYEPSHNVIAGTWACPLPMELLPACYEALLAAAQAQHNCRFWLLDMRQRNWHSAEFGYWFRTEFVRRAVATLGQPLFIACVVGTEQQHVIESAATSALLRQTAAFNCYPFYFSCEAAALAWLHDQRAAEQASPAGHAHTTIASR